MNTKQINAANADELMEQREQSQACLGYAESRQKKTEGQKIMQLYETEFPEDKQIPWDDLMRLVGEMPLDFTAYYDGEAFVGFTIVYPRKSFNRRTKQGQNGTCSSYALQGGGRPKVNWFWYFAVREELRGKGFSQQILTQLIERYKGQPFALDMESTTQVCDNPRTVARLCGSPSDNQQHDKERAGT